MTRNSLLVLETDAQLAVALELFFRGRGFRVRVAVSPGEALRISESSPFDAILIGTFAESTDCATVAARLRALHAPHPVPILLLAHAMDAVAEVDLVIPLGAHPRAILEGVRTLIRRRHTERPSASEEA